MVSPEIHHFTVLGDNHVDSFVDYKAFHSLGLHESPNEDIHNSTDDEPSNNDTKSSASSHEDLSKPTNYWVKIAEEVLVPEKEENESQPVRKASGREIKKKLTRKERNNQVKRDKSVESSRIVKGIKPVAKEPEAELDFEG